MTAVSVFLAAILAALLLAVTLLRPMVSAPLPKSE